MSKRANLVKELRNLEEAELQRRLSALRETLRELSFRTSGDEIRDMHKLSKTRREIATALTIINEKRRLAPTPLLLKRAVGDSKKQFKK